jgi:methyl-accepting chemotaxis protein
MQKKRRDRRLIKLIKPRFQLKLVGVFVGLSALGFMLQAMHVALRLSELSASIPEGGSYLMALIPELPIEILTVSFGMLLPFTVAVGILVTFRIAGPVYRLEQYLRSVIAGEESGPCQLRKGDEFGELCELINEVTASVRQQQLKPVSTNTPSEPDLESEDEELRQAS